MVRNWANKKFKGFAYIDFSESGSLKKAIKQFHGKSFQGRTLVCDAVLSTMKKGFKKRDPYYE
jgi:RNA recognition motif-containing protein